MQPLEALSENLTKRDPYDLTPMPAQSLPKELQLVLEAMNRFMARIDGQIENMRNLISDTAHQLRTPVAAIRVQAETATTQPEDAETRQRALDRLLARTRSLGTLLDQLLSRALIVHRTDSAPRIPVDLREIALEIFERDDHATLTPWVELKLDIDDCAVMVSGDVFSLQEAARNLLENAIQHGVSPVTVGASQANGEAVLWVQDSGAGPDDAVMSKLGTRFNRSAGTSESGTGIGLSIVYEVAQAFGGTVEMAKNKNGFRAALILPFVKVPVT